MVEKIEEKVLFDGRYRVSDHILEFAIESVPVSVRIIFWGDVLVRFHVGKILPD